METAVRNSDYKRKFICLLIMCFTAAVQYVQLDSSFIEPAVFFTRPFFYHLINLGTVLLVTLFLTLLTMRLHIACLTSGVIFFILSVVNHYVVLYSGGPLTPALFASAETGLNVLGNYSFSPDKRTVFSALCFLLVILGAAAIKKIYPGRQRFSRERAGAYLLAFLLLFIPVLGFNNDRYRLNGWIFNTRGYSATYGYATCFVQESFRSMSQSVTAPPDYDKEKLITAAAEIKGSPGKSDDLPDIILILNETFYDPAIFADIKTDIPYLENYRNLENSVKGYAVSPYSRGGTNDSEFEFLTGFSDYLLTQRAPFKTYSHLNRINSIARYMSELGYTTQANHPCDSLNYDRKTAYPALGFGKSRFYEDFTEHEVYRNRHETDAANYRDLIRWYEEAGEAPRFMYLLTYQNHGGYEQNGGEQDTVHVKGFGGAAAQHADEYLTSIRMSDEALKYLTDYFDSIDRPVVLCMVGDHSPAFLYEIPGTYAPTDTEKDLLSRKIPFLIWGNRAFGKISEEDNRLLGMTDLVPLMLDTAGLPLSPYYKCLLDLSRSVPVRTGTGYYVTADGTQDTLDPSDDLFEKISLPLYIEYAALSGDKGLPDSMFEPPGAGSSGNK